MKKAQSGRGSKITRKRSSPTVSRKQQEAALLADLEAAIRTTVKGRLPELEPWASLPSEPVLCVAVQDVEEKRGLETGDLTDAVDELRGRQSKTFLRLRYGDMYGSWQKFTYWTFPSGYTVYLHDLFDDDDCLIAAVSEDGYDEGLALQIIEAAFAGQFDADGSCCLDIVSAKTTLKARSPLLDRILAM